MPAVAPYARIVGGAAGDGVDVAHVDVAAPLLQHGAHVDERRSARVDDGVPLDDEATVRRRTERLGVDPARRRVEVLPERQDHRIRVAGGGETGVAGARVRGGEVQRARSADQHRRARHAVEVERERQRHRRASRRPRRWCAFRSSGCPRRGARRPATSAGTRRSRRRLPRRRRARSPWCRSSPSCRRWSCSPSAPRRSCSRRSADRWCCRRSRRPSRPGS